MPFRSDFEGKHFLNCFSWLYISIDDGGEEAGARACLDGFSGMSVDGFSFCHCCTEARIFLRRCCDKFECISRIVFPWSLLVFSRFLHMHQVCIRQACIFVIWMSLQGELSFSLSLADNLLVAKFLFEL